MIKRWYIIELRKKANLSVQEMADMMGTSKSVLWGIEQLPSSNPTLKTLKKIADFFEIQVTDIIIGEEKFRQNINSY